MNPALQSISGEPIAATAIWRAVTRAAGRRCTCTGACGRPHTRTEDRCAKTTPTDRLYAAPADSAVPTSTAYRVPVAELAAWCGPCLDGAHRRHRTPPPALVDADALFDLPDATRAGDTQRTRGTA